MKRRDLLVAGGGLLGGLPLLAKGAPCPPPNISLDGAAYVGTACASPSNALGDWNARIQAPGVLWASRFQSAADVTKWTGPNASQSSTYAQFMAGRGVIPGDGCFRQFMPAGSGAPSGGWQWGRPMQPFPDDINQPNVPTRPGPAQGVTTAQMWNQQNAFIMNPAYANTPHGTPARTGVSMGSEFYLQYRVRFSVGRMYGAGTYSKMVMCETNYNSSQQELVLNAKAQSMASVPSIYTGKYETQGNALENPQMSGPGSSSLREPGSNYIIPSGTYAGQSAGNVCSANNGVNACWQWPEDVWVTVLEHWKPGLASAGSTVAVTDSRNDGARNTQVEVFVATAADIAAGRGYTCVHSKSDYVWTYSNDAQWNAGGGLQAYGLNWVNLNYYTGGGNWLPQSIDWYHEFDQVIFSLQTIACPTV